ncbi:MAG: hypothetical protein ACLVKA_05565 [Collinsella aerofaciens]
MTKTKAQQIMAATEVRAADEVTVAIRDIAAEFEPYIIKQRRHFHKHPELSLAEERTTSDIANQLDAKISLRRPLKTGLWQRFAAPRPTLIARTHTAPPYPAARRYRRPARHRADRRGVRQRQ